MSATPEKYVAVLEDAGIDSESVSVVIVTGRSRDEVATVLSIDLSTPMDPAIFDDEVGAYAVVDILGGVLAIETTGYADPGNDALAALSAGGRATAVARSNVDAHERFGCARDGVLVFDADEFMYVEEDEKHEVPTELRPLFDSARVDPDGDDGDDGPAGLYTALAMGEIFTRLEVSAGDLTRALASGFFRAPAMTYPG